MKRPIRTGEVAYIGVRVVRKSNDEFGEYEVVPLNISTAIPLRQGRYLYVHRDEMVTVEDARTLIETAGIHQSKQEQAVPRVPQTGLVPGGEGRVGGNLPPRPKWPTGER